MTKKKYTHIDQHGERWRFEGSKPISELADRVMERLDLLIPPTTKTKTDVNKNNDNTRKQKREA